MESVISWGQLLTSLGIFLVFYYAIILLLFYGKELTGMAKAGKKVTGDRTAYFESNVSEGQTNTKADATLYNQVHEVIEDCKLVFHAAVEQQLEKMQVLEALQFRLQKYPQLKGTVFQVAVTNHIGQELENRCGMVLLEHEIESLWKG